MRKENGKLRDVERGCVTEHVILIDRTPPQTSSAFFVSLFVGYLINAANALLSTKNDQN